MRSRKDSPMSHCLVVGRPTRSTRGLGEAATRLEALPGALGPPSTASRPENQWQIGNLGWNIERGVSHALNQPGFSPTESHAHPIFAVTLLENPN